MPSIFINYRHADGGGYAGRIFDRLRSRFGDGEVFRDVDRIDSGTRFPEMIARQLEDCRVFIVVIGPTWLGASGQGAGRRLDDTDDWVRTEIATALRRNICIVPVTVGGASAPAARDLPDDIKGLATWQRRDLRDGDTWDSDLDLLVRRIASELHAKPALAQRKPIVLGSGIALVVAIAAVVWFSLDRSQPAVRQPAVADVGSSRPAAPPAEGPPAHVVFFNNTNTDPVGSGPRQPTIFSITKPYFVTRIYTYHWNGGRGSPPGQISLIDANHNERGPWEARGVEGSGVPNASWLVEPNIVLPAGTYRVIDSNPGTWSQNEKSEGRGFAFIQGHPRE